ncbi:acetyl-CoA carboxylase biotin carboxyl carrier protein [Frisingicoccus sp.]|uniref:acetyl-CoA carboxylase biotin carboxyl carrier protein n=1 Tax=Frisingicoccus sp. TaxID=1918627 RepID=UPI002EB1EDCF|nr:acetyl-CoA carboxylase biotin carboxyl carrier protein [Frisingicoccus sp.]
MMEFNQLIQLVETVAASGLNEFDYEEGDMKLHLGRKAPKMVKVAESSISNNIVEKVDVLTEMVEPSSVETKAQGTAVVSPIVGVFYAASSPEAEPFVKVGDRIQKGQVIGIVEAMKLMNEIESDVSGVVTEICVADGEGVEYGQSLIRVQE